MAREKAKGPGYEDLHYRLDEMVSRMVHDYKNGKSNAWPVVGKSLLHRVWSDFVKDGYVRDDRALENIFSIVRDNVVRLQIANILGDHEGVPPETIIEEYLEEHEYEGFCSWVVDFEDEWRISDYGLPQLQDAIALAFEAKQPAQKLKFIDRALNVVHQRGDLAKLFVDGGRDTMLDTEDLSEKFDIIPIVY